MKLRYLAALPLLVAAPAAATVKNGVVKWRAGDWAGAVTEWLPYAARGDADALFDLGQAYKLGRGVHADPAMAQTYYLKAAIKGHAQAQEKLGLTLYEQPATKVEGIRWLTQAAAQDAARAQYALAVAYFNGDGVAANRPLGYAYMRRAEKGGMPEATPALAAMLAKLTPAEKARGDQLTLPSAPQPAQGAATGPTPRAITASAAPLPAAPAAPQPGGYRVQIGAFASRAEADDHWAKLTAEQKALAGSAPPIRHRGCRRRTPADRAVRDARARAQALRQARQGTARLLRRRQLAEAHREDRRGPQRLKVGLAGRRCRKRGGGSDQQHDGLAPGQRRRPRRGGHRETPSAPRCTRDCARRGHGAPIPRSSPASRPAPPSPSPRRATAAAARHARR